MANMDVFKFYKIMNDNGEVIFVGYTKYTNINYALHTLKQNRDDIEDPGSLTIEHLEDYECENRKEANKRKAYYIELYKPSHNIIIPQRVKTPFDKFIRKLYLLKEENEGKSEEEMGPYVRDALKLIE